MVKHNVRLTSAEIGGLWETYYQLTMSMCLTKVFLQHLENEDIKSLLEGTKVMINNQIQEITDLFSAEEISIPDGFSDKDIDLSAPQLFYDPFVLSFLYMISRMNMINYSFVTSNVVRKDIVTFFTKSLNQFSDLYSKSIHLMLSKGLYDRPPMIPYPKKVEYIEKKSYAVGFLGNKRPLNAMELTEIFFNIERNYFSVLFCMALSQVVKDEEIKSFIKEGRKISEEQIRYFNKILTEENLLGIVTTNVEVTESTVSPFSNKLIMALFTFLNSIDITLISHALSMSMRADLLVHSMHFIKDILTYTGKGFSIMVNRNWLEQPPQAVDRNKLEESED